MLRQRRSRLPGDPLPYATDETDIAVALVRTAFVIAFALTPTFRRMPLLPPMSQALIQLMLPLGVTLTLLLFASYLWHFRLRLKRPVALMVDLLLVTGAMAAYGPSAPQRQWLMAVYYLIIMVAAVWYRRAGATIVALAASVLQTAVQAESAFGWLVVVNGNEMSLPVAMFVRGQAAPMLMIGIAASYIVIARDTERTRAGRLEHDMAMARRLQDNLFPAQLPRAPALDIGIRFQPARAVGGDLYDVIELDQGKLLICTGDMAGKSVYGLVHLSLVQSHMKAGARQALEPQQIAEFINRNVYDALQPDSYAALFLGEMDPFTGTLTFVNCGHLPPVIVRGGETDECVELSTSGIVIGGKPEPQYRQGTEVMRSGDILVCYTDGITEARGRRNEEFGCRRMVQIVRQNNQASAQELAGLIIQATDKFSLDAAGDDRTVLVVKAQPTLRPGEGRPTA